MNGMMIKGSRRWALIGESPCLTACLSHRRLVSFGLLSILTSGSALTIFFYTPGEIIRCIRAISTAVIRPSLDIPSHPACKWYCNNRNGFIDHLLLNCIELF